MEGGIAIFLLFLIILAGLVLAFVLGGLGGGLQAMREKRGGGEPERPAHTVVEDDGTSSGHAGDRLAG